MFRITQPINFLLNLSTSKSSRFRPSIKDTRKNTWSVHNGRKSRRKSFAWALWWKTRNWCARISIRTCRIIKATHKKKWEDPQNERSRWPNFCDCVSAFLHRACERSYTLIQKSRIFGRGHVYVYLFMLLSFDEQCARERSLLRFSFKLTSVFAFRL